MFLQGHRELVAGVWGASEEDRMTERCVYCDGPAEGHYAVHRDGFGVGPEVPLCDACGGHLEPTLADIWTRIAQPAEGDFAWREKEN